MMDMLQAGPHRCPRCGAELLIQSPPPGAMVTQAIETLRCPVCGAILGQVPTGGWSVSISGGKTMSSDVHRWQVRCPRCGRMVWLEAPMPRPLPAWLANYQGDPGLTAILERMKREGWTPEPEAGHAEVCRAQPRELYCPYCGASLGRYPVYVRVLADQTGGRGAAYRGGAPGGLEPVSTGAPLPLPALAAIAGGLLGWLAGRSMVWALLGAAGGAGLGYLWDQHMQNVFHEGNLPYYGGQ